MTLTPDSDLNGLLVGCADEPIRVPGAIQPHGVLLTVDEFSWTVQQASANAHLLLGASSTQRSSQPVGACLGAETAIRLREACAFLRGSSGPTAAS